MFLLEAVGVFRVLFMIFVIFAVAKGVYSGVYSSSQSGSKNRRRLGLIGLVVGACSAFLFAWFYIHVWVFDSLVAHGSMLWTYTALGLSLSLAGLATSSTGIGWTAQSGLFISLVMIFQWSREFLVSMSTKHLMDIGMFTTLAVFGLTLLGRAYLVRSLLNENSHNK